MASKEMESKVTGKEAIEEITETATNGFDAGSEGIAAADLLNEAAATEDSNEFDDSNDVLSGMEPTGLALNRKQFLYGKEKKKCWSYFVEGVVRGNRKATASFSAIDKGGYEPLDIAFDGADSIPLWRKPIELRDEKTGRVTYSGYQYYGVSQDEFGMTYVAQVKPSEKSDLTILDTLVRRCALEAQLAKQNM